MQQQLSDTQRGERYGIKDKDGYYVGFTGVKRQTSDSIAYLLDSGRFSYESIGKALDDIIHNNGQENHAAAKRVELVLDDMLTNGYADVDGLPHGPNEAYIAEKAKIPGAEVTEAAQQPDGDYFADLVEDGFDTAQEQAQQRTAQETEAERRKRESYKDVPGLRWKSVAPARVDELLRTGLAELDGQQGVGNDGEVPDAWQYSISGEKAKTADKAALERAKEMQRRGESDETIWRETGWYQGRDGRWRWEIDDSGMEYDKSGDTQGAVSRRWAMEDLEAAKTDLQDTLSVEEMKDVRKYNAARVYGDEAEMRRLYEQNAQKYGAVFTDYVEALDWANTFSAQVSDGMRLGDFLKHDELFEAYPRLRDVELRFEKMDDGTRGSYSASENLIRLDSSLRDAPEDTLIHEIQHAIQDAEGFSPGASPEYWARREYESGDFVSDRLQQEYDRVFNGLDKNEQNKVIRYNELERELERLFLADENSEDGRRYAKLEKEQDALYEELYPNKWFRDLLDLDRRMTDTQGEYQRMYRNTAGEIEARDTVKRRGMTPEERRQTMPDRGDESTVFADGDESYVIGKTTKNKPFVEIKQDILAGVPVKDWVKTVKENLKQKFPNGITVGNSEINIDYQSRNEMTFSNYMKWLYKNNPQKGADKLRATDNADEILLATTDWVNEGLNHPRKDKIVDFARGNILLRVGGSDYTAEVVVGTKKNGSMLLYDILNLQPTSFTAKETDAAIAENPSPGTNRSTAPVSDRSIFNSGENVNRKFSVSEDSQGRELTEAQQEFFKDSAVRDEDGRLLPVYHATYADEFTVFDRGMLGENTDGNATDDSWAATSHIGFWFSSENLSGKSGLGNRAETVYLNITSPYYADSLESLAAQMEQYEGSPAERGEAFADWLRSEGYDGVAVQDEEFGGTSYVALESEQVKRVSNQNPTGDPDIRYSVSEGKTQDELLNFVTQFQRATEERFREVPKETTKETVEDNAAAIRGDLEQLAELTRQSEEAQGIQRQTPEEIAESKVNARVGDAPTQNHPGGSQNGSCRGLFFHGSNFRCRRNSIGSYQKQPMQPSVSPTCASPPTHQPTG